MATVHENIPNLQEDSYFSKVLHKQVDFMVWHAVLCFDLLYSGKFSRENICAKSKNFAQTVISAEKFSRFAR